MSGYLAEVPVNGTKEVAQGSVAGCRVSFDNLKEELVKKGVMDESEFFSQVNVDCDSLVFYFKGKDKEG